MLKNIKFLLMGLIIVVVLAGCGHKKETDTETDTETLKYSDEQIVFIKEYSNWAAGYQYSATYVTANGKEYTFSYYGDYGSEPYRVEDVLNFPMDEVQGEISAKDMKELIMAFDKIGNISFTDEPFADDYGQYSVYGVKYNDQNNAEFVYLGSFGDVHNIPDDKYAKKICNFFGLVWDK